MTNQPRKFEICNVDDIQPLPCPCGSTQRAFIDDPDQTASLHVVSVNDEARTHYHRRLTEIYYVLAGSGQMELDGEQYDVCPGTSILIKPGCRHRALGNLRIINVAIPAFDPNDEWFD